MAAMTKALRLVRTVAASPERVFEAWTTSEQMKLWTCPDPTARVDVEIDLRVGGRYSIRMDVEGGPFIARGTYREVDPPRRRNSRGPNHGRESSKVIQDCMIRHSCRWAGPCWTVPE